MKITFSGTHKSLGPFSIEDLPMFVVLTGLNGSGKSQFLELIQQSTNPRQKTKATFGGESYTISEVLRLTSEWTNLSNSQAVGFQVVQQQHGKFWSEFANFSRDPNSVSHLRPLFQALADEIGKSPAQVTQDEFTNNFDLSAPLAQTEVFNESVNQAFLDFRIRQLEANDSGGSLTADPPWTLLRQIISKANLPFSFTDPSEISMRSNYTFALTHTGFRTQIQFSELSSGEKVLMSLVFWLFHVQRTHVFPRLLLLDEPDAHLHPEMCQQFFDVVNGVLVKKHKVRVMITTHNPTTVALAPRDSLYEMFPSGERIRKARSKSDTIRRLTAGLVNVSEAKCIVIVEDEDDERFFQSLFDELSVEVGNAATDTLRSGERLVFVQASRPRRDRKRDDTTGGRSEVEKWVPKLRDVGLDSVVGLVDWDNKDDAGESIYLLRRYSLENYLVDPILVFARLIAEEQAPKIDGVPTLGKNREHLVSLWNQEQLQNVADVINARIWQRLRGDDNADGDETSSDLEQVTVQFSNGVQLQYPNWLLQRRGKDLLLANINEFDGKYVNQQKLTDTFQQLMLVPSELVDLLTSIQERKPFTMSSVAQETL